MSLQPKTNKQQIRQDVQDIFRDVLDNPELILDDTLTSSKVGGWDSLAHINLVRSIEQHYKIRFTLGEHDELTDVGYLLSMIEIKLSK